MDGLNSEVRCQQKNEIKKYEQLFYTYENKLESKYYFYKT